MNFDYKKVIKPDVNVGDREQRIRLLTGTAMVFISIFTASIILLLVGLILIATGYFGRCPAYAGIGRSTVEDTAPEPAPVAASKDKAEKKAKPAAKKPAAKKSTATKAKAPAKKAASSKPKAAAKKTTPKK